jgi:hypothetical protein
LGINISLRVIELPEKKGSYSAIFELVEGKLLFIIFNMEAGRQSYRKIAWQKKLVLDANILHSVAGKEGFPFGRF